MVDRKGVNRGVDRIKDRIGGSRGPMEWEGVGGIKPYPKVGPGPRLLDQQRNNPQRRRKAQRAVSERKGDFR